jgi:H+-transporting ATPase
MQQPLLDTSSKDEEAIAIDPIHSEGLTTEQAQQRLKQYGYNELAEEDVNPIIEFLKNFWGPMPIMIWIAIIIEGIPKYDAETRATQPDWADFFVLLVLQLVNGLVSWHEHHKAADAVAALKNQLAPKSCVKRDGVWVDDFPARELVPGDLVNLTLGKVVPADCQVIGPKQIYCDQASLTGESLPVKIDVGSRANMGSIVATGECDALVVGTGDQTFFGKTAKLIAGVKQTSNFQKVLFKITGVLLGLSLILTGVILAYLIAQDVNPLEALGICVVLLVASIPIAMQVVCTSTMAIGSRKLAEKKAIVTRLAAIEELAGMDMLCSDKTGTLTLGKMQMQEIIVYEYEDEAADSAHQNKREPNTTQDILKYACLAAKWWEPAKDAIDRLVLGSAMDGSHGDLMSILDTYEPVDYMPFDPKYKRTESQVRSRGTPSTDYKVTKGAPQVILNMCSSCPVEQSTLISNKISELAARGIRSLGIAVCQAKDEDNEWSGWRFVGILTFLDPPRHDTKLTIERAQNLGIDVKMITGDQVAIAKETCFQLGMGTNIRGTEVIPDDTNISAADAVRFREIIEELDGFAEVYPEHKYKIVDTFRDIGYRCGMTGDGVNDAPALKRADIGIAVQGATDAARAAADIVLTEEGLSVIIDAIYISRKIFKRMKNYVTYRIACTIQLLLFFFIAVLSIHPDRYSLCISTNSTSPFPQTYCLQKNWKKDNGGLLPKPKCDTANPFNDTSACICSGLGQAKTVSAPGLPCNPGYFKLPVIALVLITILNDGTIISIAYDHVVPHKYPEKWALPRVVVESTLLGGVACVSSILLLVAAMNSGTDDDILNHAFGLNPLTYSQVTCLMYLKVSISDFLTVFAARTQGFFITRRPGNALMVAFILATTASSLFAHLWPFGGMEGLPGEYVLFTWIYCILCFFVQDICKVTLNLAMDALEFGAETTAKSDPERDAHRLARVRLAEEKHQRSGTVSSPHVGPSSGMRSSSSMGALGLGTAAITSKEDIARRMDVLAAELEVCLSTVLVFVCFVYIKIKILLFSWSNLSLFLFFCHFHLSEFLF